MSEGIDTSYPSGRKLLTMNRQARLDHAAAPKPSAPVKSNPCDTPPFGRLINVKDKVKTRPNKNRSSHKSSFM